MLIAKLSINEKESKILKNLKKIIEGNYETKTDFFEDTEEIEEEGQDTDDMDEVIFIEDGDEE